MYHNARTRRPTNHNTQGLVDGYHSGWVVWLRHMWWNGGATLLQAGRGEQGGNIAAGSPLLTQEDTRELVPGDYTSPTQQGGGRFGIGVGSGLGSIGARMGMAGLWRKGENEDDTTSRVLPSKLVAYMHAWIAAESRHRARAPHWSRAVIDGRARPGSGAILVPRLDRGRATAHERGGEHHR